MVPRGIDLIIRTRLKEILETGLYFFTGTLHCEKNTCCARDAFISFEEEKKMNLSRRKNVIGKLYAVLSVLWSRQPDFPAVFRKSSRRKCMDSHGGICRYSDRFSDFLVWQQSQNQEGWMCWQKEFILFLHLYLPF